MEEKSKCMCLDSEFKAEVVLATYGYIVNNPKLSGLKQPVILLMTFIHHEFWNGLFFIHEASPVLTRTGWSPSKVTLPLTCGTSVLAGLSLSWHMSDPPGPPHVVGPLTTRRCLGSHTSQAVAGFQETGSESCQSPKTWIQKLLHLHCGHIQVIKRVMESNQIQGEGHRLPTYQWEECQRICGHLPQSALWSQTSHFLSIYKIC